MEESSIKNTDVSFYVKKLDNHIQRLMYSLYSRRKFQEYSLMNMWVVDFIYNQQDHDVFQKDVEAEFFINRATASKMLKLMEQKQLITRTNMNEDARLKKILLTPKGIELRDVCLQIRREIEDESTKTLTDEETALFKSLCRKIIEGMED